MESLRWILLAVGIIFVLLIYVLGRSRRRHNHSILDEQEEDLPEFSAQNLDNLDEGVGEVRIITGAGLGTDVDVADIAPISISTVNDQPEENPDEASQFNETSENKTAEDETSAKGSSYSDIIVLYILPKGNNYLIGSQINSSARAMGLSFGEMNIYHFKRKNRNVFGLANMLEPGSFDANTIHDLKTSGLTVFMRIQGDDPLDDLTEMLQRSYQIAGLLDARLCNHKREPLTEQDAENYRAQVRGFISGETP